jgi:hypothetical protein
MPTFGVWVQAKSPPSNLVGEAEFKSLFNFDSVTPMAYGATGDGAADDAAAIQLAVNTGKIVVLDRTYAFGSQIAWTQNGGGIVGPGSLVMLTSTGKFTNTTVGSKFATNSCGLYVNGYDNVVFSGFKISLGGSPSDDSVCLPIGIRDSTNSHVYRVEATGYKKARGLISIDSCFDSTINDNYLHDCAANGSTNGQLTGINVDDNRVSSVASERISISFNRIKNLTCNATFLAANGYQTDGINISMNESSLHVIKGNMIDTVGEGIDCFGRRCVIEGNTIQDAYVTGIKLVHGACYNNIGNNVIDGAGLYGIDIAGSSTSDRNTSYNLIHDNIITNVNRDGNWTAGGISSGIACDNSGTYIATLNTIQDNVISNSSLAAYGLRSADNLDNAWYENRLQGTFVVSRVQQAVGGSTYRSADKSFVNAQRITSSQTISNNTITDVVFNSEITDSNGEYDATTGIFTANEPRRVSVVAQVRTATGADGDTWEMYVSYDNNAIEQRFETVSKAGDFTIAATGLIDMRVGKNLRIKVRQVSGSSDDVTAGDMTYLRIMES